MPITAAGVAYVTVGGLLVFSGIKGASLTDTVKAALGGNLNVTNTEPLSASSDTPVAGGGGTGSDIVSTADQWIGHAYVYGGPSNPKDGWDCSSFVTYILGQCGIPVPGGTWGSVTQNGAEHGPVASDYLNWNGATTVTGDPTTYKPGYLLCWETHVGFYNGAMQMISAYDTQSGTNIAGFTAGPSGEKLTVRSINGVTY